MNAETHFFYNTVIMDRSHNRRIVERQLETLGLEEAEIDPDYLHIVLEN